MPFYSASRISQSYKNVEGNVIEGILNLKVSSISQKLVNLNLTNNRHFKNML